MVHLPQGRTVAAAGPSPGEALPAFRGVSLTDLEVCPCHRVVGAGGGLGGFGGGLPMKRTLLRQEGVAV